MMQRGLTVFIICCTMKWKTKLAEQNKGKAPLGKAVTRLWSYLTCLQRDRLWCSEKSSQAVTYSPENNCQTCSWAHWLPCRQHRRELFLFVQLFLLFCMLCCVASWRVFATNSAGTSREQGSKHISNIERTSFVALASKRMRVTWNGRTQMQKSKIQIF